MPSATVTRCWLLPQTPLAAAGPPPPKRRPLQDPPGGPPAARAMRMRALPPAATRDVRPAPAAPAPPPRPAAPAFAGCARVASQARWVLAWQRWRGGVPAARRTALSRARLLVAPMHMGACMNPARARARAVCVQPPQSQGAPRARSGPFVGGLSRRAQPWTAAHVMSARPPRPPCARGAGASGVSACFTRVHWMSLGAGGGRNDEVPRARPGARLAHARCQWRWMPHDPSWAAGGAPPPPA